MYKRSSLGMYASSSLFGSAHPDAQTSQAPEPDSKEHKMPLSKTKIRKKHRASSSKDKANLAFYLIKKARQFYANGIMDKAETCLNHASRLSMQYAPLIRAHICFNLGIILAMLGRQQKAITSYQDAISIYRQYPRENLTDQINILNGISLKQLTSGQHAAALVNLQTMVELYELNANKNSIDHAEALNHLGAVQTALGQYQEAKNSYQAAIDIYDITPSQKNSFYTGILINLSSAYINLGDLETAQTLLTQLLEIQKTLSYISMIVSIATQLLECRLLILKNKECKTRMKITISAAMSCFGKDSSIFLGEVLLISAELWQHLSLHEKASATAQYALNIFKCHSFPKEHPWIIRTETLLQNSTAERVASTPSSSSSDIVPRQSSNVISSTVASPTSSSSGELSAFASSSSPSLMSPPTSPVRDDSAAAALLQPKGI